MSSAAPNAAGVKASRTERNNTRASFTELSEWRGEGGEDTTTGPGRFQPWVGGNPYGWICNRGGVFDTLRGLFRRLRVGGSEHLYTTNLQAR